MLCLAHTLSGACLLICLFMGLQVVYILDQVRALEREMLARSGADGISVTPRILVVTRLIPDAMGTTCDQRIEHIDGTQHAAILRVPFRTSDGTVLKRWVSRYAHSSIHYLLARARL